MLVRHLKGDKADIKDVAAWLMDHYVDNADQPLDLYQGLKLPVPHKHLQLHQKAEQDAHEQVVTKSGEKVGRIPSSWGAKQRIGGDTSCMLWQSLLQQVGPLLQVKLMLMLYLLLRCTSLAQQKEQ